MYELMLLAAVCVFIVDVSGFTQSWKGWLGWFSRMDAERVEALRLRPFDCSLCLTWWAGLVWCLCRGDFSLLAVAECALAAASTPLVLAAWNVCKGLLLGLLDWVAVHIDRIFY